MSLFKRLKVAWGYLSTGHLPNNSAVCEYQGYTAIPEHAAKYANIMSLVEEAYQENRGWEAMELVAAWSNNSLTDDQLISELTEMIWEDNQQ